MIRALVALAIVLTISAATGQSLKPNALVGFPPGVSGTGGGTTAPLPAFDPAFNADGLSNSNKTVTTTGPGTAEGWRSVVTHSAGKVVFRFTWSTVGCCGLIGIVDNTFLASGSQTNAYIAYGADGNVWLNNFQGCAGSPVATLTAGQPVDISYDFAAKLLGVRVNNGNWNNNAAGNPSTGANMFDLTCGTTTNPPPVPNYIAFSSAFSVDVGTLSCPPDVNTGTLAGFSCW